jgi:hypothetical protein
VSFPQKMLVLALVAAVAFPGSVWPNVALGHDRPGAYWRIAEAEAISNVRGMRVRVRECRGLGMVLATDGVRRYRHFRCVAGARASWQSYDTVGVLYVLHPLGPYTGPGESRHILTNVRFIGGPGVP